MYRVYLFLTIILSLNLIRAQNNAPMVSNVTFSQRTDGSHLVDIYYDVFDPDNNYMTVKMYASNDAGSTWDFSCDRASGDARNLVLSGTQKHIVWDFGAEHPEYFSDQIQIKIIADDHINESDGLPCPDIPEVAYEGKTYNTVRIGNQCWLKENLDVGTMIMSNSSNDQPADNDVIEKFCYDNELGNCDTYGGLYEWAEAMHYDLTGNAGDICPDGWHIPTYAELQTLADAVGRVRDALLAEGQQTGSNTSGFSALFGGERLATDGSFIGLGWWAAFWSSTMNDVDDQGLYWFYNMRFYGNTSRADVTFGYSPSYVTASVRCLQD